jgi:tetratricopeptide (TPR) repeat protein
MRLARIVPSVFLIAAAANAQAPAEIASGDRDYAAMNAPSALAHYQQAMKLDPSSYEASWKASRSAVDIGSYSNDKTRGEALFESGEQYARKAVQLNAGDAEGHFALARALGKTALTQSPRGRIKYATEIRSQALECLKINPKHGGCLHVMGMWNAEVMRLNSFTRLVAKNILGGKVFGTASWNEAVRYMEASVAADPERVVHYLDLAGVYEDTGNTAKARAAYEAVVRLPASDVNDRVYKQQAASALARKS